MDCMKQERASQGRAVVACVRCECVSGSTDHRSMERLALYTVSMCHVDGVLNVQRSDGRSLVAVCTPHSSGRCVCLCGSESNVRCGVCSVVSRCS